MIRRIIIATVAASLVTLVAFGQTKYSRTRAPSPTPTPTPAGAPMPGPNRWQMQTQRATPTPSPARPMPQMRGTPPPVRARTTPPPKQWPTPPQRAMQATPVPAQNVAIQPKAPPAPAPIVAKPTPTPVPPPDTKAYLDRQVANSKDQKFHFTVNGKDLALTPFHVWAQKSTGPNSTSTCIDMRGDDGRVYDIDFMTTGPQVTGIRIHRINGESLR